MVPAGDLVGGLQKRLVCKAFGLLQHLCAQHTVGLDHRKFLWGQPAGLIQDGFVNADLTDIVQRRRQRNVILLLGGQVVAAGQFHQPVQQRLGDDADVPHMRAGLAVAELHDLAQHAHQHIGVLFAGADLVGHHLHQPPLLGVQLDGVDHPAVDDLGVKGAADVIACAQFVGLADDFFRVIAGDHDHRHILDGVVGVHGAQHLKAVHDRHIDIQQHQRDLPGLFL